MKLARKTLLTVVGGSLAAASIAAAAPALAEASTFQYDAVGTTRIGGQVNADAKLGPAVLSVSLDTATGVFNNGTLPLPKTKVTFPVFGGLTKLRADVNFIQSGKITGTLTNDAQFNSVVTANAKYTIKLTNVEKAGLIPGTWTPLFVGNSCQTAQPVSLNLKTPAGQSFDVDAGGTVAGKYTIGQFTGCSVLFIPGLGSVVVNALVPNSNNFATIQLSNGRVVG